MKQIKLANNKGFAFVDDKDFDELSKYKWSLEKRRRTSYAKTNIKINGKWKVFRMHNLIVGAKKGQEIDHRDGNGLNNQRQNLRCCTRSQNCRNMRKTRGTSRYKGVCWDKNNKKWMAAIELNYEKIYIGRFDSEVRAAAAYDCRAIELFGEYAKLNFKEVA